jgi:hypothetical protein
VSLLVEGLGGPRSSADLPEPAAGAGDSRTVGCGGRLLRQLPPVGRGASTLRMPLSDSLISAVVNLDGSESEIKGRFRTQFTMNSRLLVPYRPGVMHQQKGAILIIVKLLKMYNNLNVRL